MAGRKQRYAPRIYRTRLPKLTADSLERILERTAENESDHLREAVRRYCLEEDPEFPHMLNQVTELETFRANPQNYIAAQNRKILRLIDQLNYEKQLLQTMERAAQETPPASG